MVLVLVEVLSAVSIDQIDIDWMLEVEIEKDLWMTLIKEYLLNGTLIVRRNEQRKLLHQTSRFIV